MSIQKTAAKLTRVLAYHAIIAASVAYFAPVATAAWLSLNIVGANAWIGSFGYSMFGTTVLRYMAQALALEFGLPFIASSLDIFLENRNKNIEHTVTAIVGLGIWYRQGFLNGIFNSIYRGLGSIPGAIFAERLNLNPEYNATPLNMAAAAGGMGGVIAVSRRNDIEELRNNIFTEDGRPNIHRIR